MGKNEYEQIDFTKFNDEGILNVIVNTTDIPSLVEDFATMMRKKEEELFVTILKNYLGRVPTNDDAKKCTLATNALHPGKKLLAYNGEIIGRIETIHELHSSMNEYNTTIKYGYRFIPYVDRFI